MDGDRDHTVVAQSPRELDRDHVERRLRCAVADVAAHGRADHHRADLRRDVDDARPARPTQRRQESAGEKHRAESVDSHLAHEVLGRELEDVAFVGGQRPDPAAVRPALLTSTSIASPPTAATKSAIERSSPVSTAWMCSVTARSSSALSGVRQPPMTVWPRAAKALANSRPRPRLAPVITTVSIRCLSISHVRGGSTRATR